MQLPKLAVMPVSVTILSLRCLRILLVIMTVILSEVDLWRTQYSIMMVWCKTVSL